MRDNLFIHRASLQKAVQVTVDFLQSKGYRVPVKQRDPREPKKLEKVKLERRLQDIFVRRFKEQYTLLKADYKAVKPKLPKPVHEDYFIEEIITALISGTRGGVDIFAETVLIGLDYTIPNQKAADWAKKYAFELVKGIDETTQDVLERAISGFVEESGVTLGDIIDTLSPYFGDVRAGMIATTETTRAFAQGQLEAGKEMQDEFPDVQVFKRWYTNNDDRVCDICGPLEGQEIPMNDEFEGGISDPPAHVNCRCWTDYSTRVSDGG